MCGLNRGAVGKSDAKNIAHRLFVVAQGVEFDAVASAASIGDDRGGAGQN